MIEEKAKEVKKEVKKVKKEYWSDADRVEERIAGKYSIVKDSEPNESGQVLLVKEV